MSFEDPYDEICFWRFFDVFVCFFIWQCVFRKFGGLQVYDQMKFCPELKAWNSEKGVFLS